MALKLSVFPNSVLGFHSVKLRFTRPSLTRQHNHFNLLNFHWTTIRHSAALMRSNAVSFATQVQVSVVVSVPPDGPGLRPVRKWCEIGPSTFEFPFSPQRSNCPSPGLTL